ncbi:flagellar biosynthetic protein FliO [Neptunomonas antarctica]|uniref:Flagellar protein n=1 Tax=Neptunomonas antarctica TaxID=619304 RepID=A0A1N7JCC8_9GAMM|nr:flagellar biosynthetic protein FliO [Neptunomonas antarctica]SIS46988.1 flagellar protein FliO/FliZ [Neptunomonas antarctica]
MSSFHLIRYSLVWVLFFLPVSMLSAAEPSAPSVSQDVLTSNAVMQMLLGLGLVVVVILGLAWVLRRVSNLQQSHQKMKVISSLSLGTRERAVLIEIGDRQLLLGVAAGHVSLLESFSERIITPASKKDFAKQLQQSIDKSIDTPRDEGSVE